MSQRTASHAICMHVAVRVLHSCASIIRVNFDHAWAKHYSVCNLKLIEHKGIATCVCVELEPIRVWVSDSERAYSV